MATVATPVPGLLLAGDHLRVESAAFDMERATISGIVAAFVLGIVSVRRRVVGLVGLGVFGALGVAAALTRPTATSTRRCARSRRCSTPTAASTRA